jgi:hypothetical protein
MPTDHSAKPRACSHRFARMLAPTSLLAHGVPMNRFRRFVSLMLLACATSAFSQQPDARVASAAVPAAAEAHAFDFLIGQWQVEVHPKVSSLVAMIHGTPHLVGTWTAVRAADGAGVEDDLRIVDGSGNPISSNHTVRAYVEAERQWKISANDAANKRGSESHGHLQDGVMRLEGRFTDADGNVTLTRTRYSDISADGFRMQQDRSTDNGQTWDENVLAIDAKRTARAAGS